MSVITPRQRKKFADAIFAGPGRSYPIPDKAHAANAKARATQMVNAGKLSASAAAHIRAVANRKLAQ